MLFLRCFLPVVSVGLALSAEHISKPRTEAPKVPETLRVYGKKKLLKEHEYLQLLWA